MHCWAGFGRSREISSEIRTCRKLSGEIRTPRTFSGRNWTLRSLRVSKCRPITSLLSKSRPKTKRYPKVARQHHDVQISPKNTAASARKTRGRRTARAQPWRSICNPDTISCITLGAKRPGKPAKPTVHRSAGKIFSFKMPPATARFRFCSDTRQIFVRYFRIFPVSVSSHQ